MEYQTGRIVQIQGSVVDVEFSADNMPELYEALEVVATGGPAIVLEVEKHLGNNVVRCVAMDTTDGMQRHVAVKRTGSPIRVPVGPNILGRVFNVLETPLITKVTYLPLPIIPFTGRLLNLKNSPPVWRCLKPA